MPAKSCSAVDRCSSESNKLNFSVLSDPEEHDEEDESDDFKEEEKKKRRRRKKKNNNNDKRTNVSCHWTDMGKGEKGGQCGNGHRCLIHFRGFCLPLQ